MYKRNLLEFFEIYHLRLVARIAAPDFAQNIGDELRRFGKIAPAYKHMHEVYRDIFTSFFFLTLVPAKKIQIIFHFFLKTKPGMEGKHIQKSC